MVLKNYFLCNYYTADEFRKILFFYRLEERCHTLTLIVRSLICLSVSVDEILQKSLSIWYEIKTTY